MITSIQAMLSKPGIYVIVGNNMFFVEVEPDKTCHQLSFEMERDGILEEAGWNPDVDFKIFGPFRLAV